MIDMDFLEYCRKVRDRSISIGIPSIDEEEGFLIYSLTYMHSIMRKEKLYIIDAGAGIGYSTLWIVKALEDSDCEQCLVEAIEIFPYYASEILDTINGYGFRKVRTKALNIDAIEYISKLDDECVDVAFVDIDKQRYPLMLNILSSKIKDHGMIMFHNAIRPSPPKEFLDQATKPPWRSTIIPTSLGILLGFKIGRR